MKLPKFKSRAFLAPMAGISDPAFRTLCSEMGAGLVVTELTSIHAIVAKEKELSENGKKITEFIEFSEKERPISIQLFGSDIPLLKKAAQIVEPYFDIIDYNMGCPAPHITNQMAGAALLQKPELTEKIFKTLIDAVDKPVTLKMRAGINNNDCYLWKPIAKLADNCGISMITLHPRTIKQGYSGKSNWQLIRELRSDVSEQTAVVGNGDITKPEHAKQMIEETGCNYVMIGRGAMGNPQIFRQIDKVLRSEHGEQGTESWTKTSFEEKKKTLYKYLELTKQYPTIKFASIRTQAMQFTKGIEGGKNMRAEIAKAKTIQEIKEKFLNK